MVLLIVTTDQQYCLLPKTVRAGNQNHSMRSTAGPAELEVNLLVVPSTGFEGGDACGKFEVGIVGDVGRDSFVRCFGQLSCQQRVQKGLLVFDLGAERIQALS
jgi:hypothetical protein